MCLAPTFKNNFQNTKNKKKLFGRTFLFLRFKKKKYLQKVMCRICRLLFLCVCVDNDKGIELIMYFFFLIISFKFEG